MPDEAWWNTFFDPPAILQALGLDQIEGPVIDVGCGYGTFTLGMARNTQHPVISLDIEPALMAEVGARADPLSLSHVRPRVIDVTHGSLGVEDSQVPDAARVSEHFCSTDESLGGNGTRLGAAYRLANGEVVYVPETAASVPAPRSP